MFPVHRPNQRHWPASRQTLPNIVLRRYAVRRVVSSRHLEGTDLFWQRQSQPRHGVISSRSSLQPWSTQCSLSGLKNYFFQFIKNLIPFGWGSEYLFRYESNELKLSFQKLSFSVGKIVFIYILSKSKQVYVILDSHLMMLTVHIFKQLSLLLENKINNCSRNVFLLILKTINFF